MLARLLLKNGNRRECLSYRSSLTQSANVRDQRVDLEFREFLSIRRHLAFAVHDRIEYAFVTHTALPSGIGQISSVF